MNPSLRERFARLGPVRGVDRVPSGTPAVFMLRLRSDSDAPRSIDAMFALARRGLTMLKAKRHIETLLEQGKTFVQPPTVEDPRAVTEDLITAGFDVVHIEQPLTPDVLSIRKRLGLSREQFALRHGLEVETVRNWETGKREPDTTARSYLRTISNDPEQVEQAHVRPR
jgi:putative transcriptional regulator